MKTRYFAAAVICLLSTWLTCSAITLDGAPYIHDPSNIIQCDGKYYTFGTGGGGLISDDGWTWRSGAQRPGGGAAPDALKIGDRYLISYGATGGGLGGGHNGTILTMWTKSLDPQSEDFGYSRAVAVASSDGIEDCDAIDPGLLLGPDGRLWCTYGTFFGYTRVVELDPETGERVEGNEAVNIAIDCEATTMIYRNGWYYLLATHGTCCNGVTSTYNIRVGRSKSPIGPFEDNLGMEMLRGGGKLVLAANGRCVGPGHFGLIDEGDGVQKFSFHYEADMDRGGRSVLAIRPLLWKDDWPVAGDDFKGGTFEIESEGSGYALEMGVQGVPLGGGRGGGFGGFGGGRGGGGAAASIPDQDVAVVSQNWPEGNIGVRMGDYMLQAHQKWTITPVAGVGGYLGSPYFKITVAGTDRALAATEDDELEVVPAFTDQPEQLWRIDQLIDGTYRIMPKVESDTRGPLALTAVGVTTPSLAKFDPESDRGRWNFRTP
jgi:arabinan endo-1,5-alpha-L-arabinosidase